MPPIGFQGFPGPQGPMMHNMGQRGPMPMYGHQGPPMGVPNRMSSFGAPGMNGMNGMNGMHHMNGMPPPGMMHPQGRGIGFPFDGPGVNAPPGFGHQAPSHASNQTSPIGQPPSNGVLGNDAPRPSISGHSRQQSTDKERFEAGANQPIARPAPIQRPSSVKPPGDDHKSSNPDLDNLSKHLGSASLLDDSDEPIPPQGDVRRMSGIPISGRNGPLGGIGAFGPPSGGFGAPGSSWNSPSLPFGQNSVLGQQPGWGAIPPQNPMGSSWAANNAAFAAKGAFG